MAKGTVAATCNVCGHKGNILDDGYTYKCITETLKGVYCTGTMLPNDTLTEAIAHHATRGAEALTMNRPTTGQPQAVLGPDDPYVMYQHNFDQLYNMVKCSFGYIVPGEDAVECVHPVTGTYMVFAYCEKHKGYPARWEALQEKLLGHFPP